MYSKWKSHIFPQYIRQYVKRIEKKKEESILCRHFLSEEEKPCYATASKLVLILLIFLMVRVVLLLPQLLLRDYNVPEVKWSSRRHKKVVWILNVKTRSIRFRLCLFRDQKCPCSPVQCNSERSWMNWIGKLEHACGHAVVQFHFNPF